MSALAVCLPGCVETADNVQSQFNTAIAELTEGMWNADALHVRDFLTGQPPDSFWTCAAGVTYEYCFREGLKEFQFRKYQELQD